MPTSFKLIVLDPFNDLALMILKTVYWLATAILFVLVDTRRIFSDKINAADKAKSQKYLKGFISEEINPEHIQCNELELDISEVPPTIKIEDIYSFFDAIDFDDSTKLEYMPPSVRKEKGSTYTPEALKKSLTTFVDNINHTRPFLGTPPAYDVESLKNFYKQIKSGVLLCLHKEMTRLEEFELSHPDTSRYTPKQLSDYQKTKRDLFEDRARLAIDFAIAGQHCGGRYMGDVMDSYYSRYGALDLKHNTLKSALYQILAYGRAEIARQEIDEHFAQQAQSTHSYSNYMGNYGKILAIPGSKNISDGLFGKRLDDSIYLTSWGKKYHVNFILDCLQKGFKESSTLREMLTDWLRDQVGDWNKNAYPLKPILNQVKEVLKEGTTSTKQAQDVATFQELIIYLRSHSVDFKESWIKAKCDWNNFLEEILAEDLSKEWFKNQNPSKKAPQLLMLRKQIRTAYESESLGNELSESMRKFVLEGASFPAETLSQHFDALQKIKKIAQIKVAQIEWMKTINKEVFKRAIIQNADLEVIVQDHLDQMRGLQFVEELKLEETIGINDLSPELMEWVAVSHAIFNPQLPILA